MDDMFARMMLINSYKTCQFCLQSIWEGSLIPPDPKTKPQKESGIPSDLMAEITSRSGILIHFPKIGDKISHICSWKWGLSRLVMNKHAMPDFFFSFENY